MTSESARNELKLQSPVQDATVEEIRLFVRRLKKRWPDLCLDCKAVIREALN